MNSSNIKLVVFVTLLTACIGLCLIGISWLNFLGVALAVVGFAFQQGRVRSKRFVIELLICLAGAIFFFVDSFRDGVAFTRKPPEMIWLVVFIVIWLCGVARAFQWWWSGRI
jgi:hypothetical protein